MSNEQETEHTDEYYCGHCSAWVPISSGLHPHTLLSQEELLREYEGQESYESRATYNEYWYGRVPFDHNFGEEI